MFHLFVWLLVVTIITNQPLVAAELICTGPIGECVPWQVKLNPTGNDKIDIKNNNEKGNEGKSGGEYVPQNLNTLKMADPCSLSNLNEVKQTNLHLELRADFDERRINGSVTIDFEVIQDNVDKVILDSRELSI